MSACGSGFVEQSVQCASSVCVCVCYVWQCACVAGCRCVCTYGDVRDVRKCVFMAVVYSVCDESVLLCVCVLDVAVKVSSLVAGVHLLLSCRWRLLWAVLALA